MKNFFKGSLFFGLVCCFCLVAQGQKHSKHVAGKASPAGKVVCTVQSVPKGFVVVGYEPNATCAGGMKLVVKRPAVAETVCAGSPIPDGYSVQGIQASLACRNGDLNPLTNALAIVNGDAAPATARETVSRDYTAPYVPRDSTQSAEAVERANQLNAEARRANAATRGKLMLKMTMAEVEKVLGPRHSTSKKLHQRARSRSGFTKQATRNLGSILAMIILSVTTFTSTENLVNAKDNSGIGVAF